MFAQFRYLDGAMADRTRVSANDFATIGRHPGSDVPFDPEGDLQVSVRHAAVFKQGGGFMLRDLGSTNGTFVNGRRIRSDRPLEPGDLIQFGLEGPRLEFSVTDVAPRAPAPTEAPQPEPASRIRRPRTRTTDRIQVEVRRQTSRWKWIVVGTLAIAGLTMSQMAWRTRRERAELETQRSALLSRVDDLLTRIEATRSQASGIESALATARSEVASLRATIATGRATADRLDTLTRRVSVDAALHGQVLSAARFDPAAAAKASQRAVAVVVAEGHDGRVLSGSGFAIRSRGDTVLIVTARHLVQDSAGLMANRLAVIFDGTGQAFRATLIRVDDRADLALLMARIRGGAPVVAGLVDSLAVGAPVALVGYPGGLDSLGDWRSTGVSATATVGTLRAAGPDLLTIDGYGTGGSSGSPVLGPTGEVAGVVSGGDPGRSAPGVVYAVPARLIRALAGAP